MCDCVECNSTIERLRAELAACKLQLGVGGAGDVVAASGAAVQEAVKQMNALRAELAVDGEAWQRDQDRLKKAEAELAACREDAAAEALGFAHAWCCNLLDLARDPRNTEMSQLLADWDAARREA